MQRYFYEDAVTEEWEEPEESIRYSGASRVAAIGFHWRDLFLAEKYLEEALEGFRAALGERHPRAALAGSVLAQVLAVNQNSDRAVELAGQSLASLSEQEGPESHLLAPAYEARGMAYHFEGNEAEANIFLGRSERLNGGESLPRMPAPREQALPDVKAEPGSLEFRVHLPEEIDPIIH
jgi:tetratricopeptide (TPR) repeat protein